MNNKQSMKGVTAGGKVSQASDARSTAQDMNQVDTPNEVSQVISTQKEENSLSLRGFGKARGKWAVIVIGMLFVAFLVWKYFTSH